MQQNKTTFLCYYPSKLGRLTLASDGENLTGLWIEGQKYYGAALPQQKQEGEEAPVFERTKQWLEIYFSGKEPDFSLPLAPKGSPFRQLIWELLLNIPYGKVTTYKALAKEAAARLGKKTMSAQAVGGAVGHNPVSIIIPCHRVVGTDNSLTGYAGGIDKKIKLLELEHIDTNVFHMPK